MSSSAPHTQERLFTLPARIKREKRRKGTMLLVLEPIVLIIVIK